MLLEGPTGSFRSLMYKGDLANAPQQRTPSLYLAPSTNHLSLRFSSQINDDVGVTSNQELPLQQWTHVAVTFHNVTLNQILPTQGRHLRMDKAAEESRLFLRSHANTHAPEGSRTIEPEQAHSSTHGEDDAKYRFTLYINGVVDLEGSFGVPVVGNAGDLRLFYDGSFAGMI